MNKKELIDAIANKTGFAKKDTDKFLNAFIGAVEDTLTAGDKVALVGFGTFKVVERAARKGRNPQTRQEITIPASKVPGFKAGSELRKKVNS